MTVVLLVNPPCGKERSEPVGLAYIASYLERNGISVSVFDVPSERQWMVDLRSILNSERPSLLGITSVTRNFPDAANIAEFCKSIDPALKIAIGGPHVTFCANETLAAPFFDFVVHSEGEETMLELAQALLTGREPDIIRGISARKRNRVIRTPRRPFIVDLDALPFPARHLLNLESYDCCSITTVRGCPYSCIYCSQPNMWGNKIRFRSPQNVLEELMELYKNHNIKRFSFSESFAFDGARAQKMCEGIIKKDMEINWTCTLRPDSVSRGLLKRMKEAGCDGIVFGAESGSQAILNLIKRGITSSEVVKGIQMAIDGRIEDVSISFIIGFPGENERTWGQTIELARRFKKSAKLDFRFLTAYPGTQLCETPERYGVKISAGRDWRKYNERIPTVSTIELSEHKIAERYLETLYAVFEYDEQNEEAVSETSLEN